MQRPGRRQPGPRDDDTSLFERLKAGAAALLERLGGEPPRQALPLDRARGQVGPVVPYHERRQQLRRHRARRDSSYALVFIVILLVLVIGIFYGLSWALSGLSFGSGGARPTPTAVPQAAVDPPPSPSPLALPPAGSGLAKPSPSPGTGAEPGAAQPASSPTTGQTYVVKPGDTPGSIAAQFGITAQQLMQANGITDPRALQVGQRLNIPPR
jgi:hypothetical protein